MIPVFAGFDMTASWRFALQLFLQEVYCSSDELDYYQTIGKKMENQIGFIFKVLVLSTALSVLIKYGGPNLNITPTSQLALVTVLLPSAILAIALWWRKWQHEPQN